MTLKVKVRGKQRPEDGEPEVGVIPGSVSPKALQNRKPMTEAHG